MDNVHFEKKENTVWISSCFCTTTNLSQFHFHMRFLKYSVLIERTTLVQNRAEYISNVHEKF